MSQRPNIEELLCDYLDGTLDAARQRQLQSLLKRHAKLRKVLDQLQQARGMLRDLPVEKMSAAASAELQDELRGPIPARAMPFYARPGLLRLAAAIALAITGGLAIWTILPVTAPSANQTVAVTAPAPHSITEAMAWKEADAKLIESETAARAMKGAPAERQAKDADGDATPETGTENELAVMLVVADDIRGTQRQIDHILTSNNISYESVTPPADVREEPAWGFGTEAMAKSAPTTPAPAVGGRAGAMPATPAAPAPMAKAEAAPPAAQAPLPAAPTAPEESKAKEALADAFKQQPGGAAAGAGADIGAGPTRATVQTLGQAVDAARQANALPQQAASVAGGQAAANYSVVVARNVTPDQLGRIRSGLRDASRSRSLRVVDTPVDRNNQIHLSRDQTQNRADNEYPFQQQAQVQMPDRRLGVEQLQKQQAMIPEPQRQVSFSLRYDLTIVVQDEATANAATQANIPVWPANQPGATQPASAPSAR